MTTCVYFFGNGAAEGTRDMKAILGGKGANLAEMTNLGVPVPPGFTIACDACMAYLRDGVVPDALRTSVEEYLTRLEEASGKTFGDPVKPRLVSVRSGAPVSMPGMMETILHLGLNDRTVAGLARASGNAPLPSTPIAVSSRCTATSCSACPTTSSSSCWPPTRGGVP